MPETAVLTLTDFLLARIAEDEAVARGATEGRWTHRDRIGEYENVVSTEGWDVASCAGGHTPPNAGRSTKAFADAVHVARHDPARVLAECESKRRIVDLTPNGTCDDAHPTMGVWHPEGHQSPILMALAAVYADHPDYIEEWWP